MERGIEEELERSSGILGCEDRRRMNNVWSSRKTDVCDRNAREKTNGETIHKMNSWNGTHKNQLKMNGATNGIHNGLRLAGGESKKSNKTICGEMIEDHENVHDSMSFPGKTTTPMTPNQTECKLTNRVHDADGGGEHDSFPITYESERRKLLAVISSIIITIILCCSVSLFNTDTPSQLVRDCVSFMKEFISVFAHILPSLITTTMKVSCLVALAIVIRLLQRANEPRRKKSCPRLKGWKEHELDVTDVKIGLSTFLSMKKPTQKLSILRSRKGTNPSNRTAEAKYKERATPLDVSQLCRVIDIDTENMLVHVEPGVAMDHMTRTAMAYGVVPQVVLEFPGITVGGAVCGGGIESSSHKFGSFVDTVVEMDILTGDGYFHKNVSRESDPDLFYAMATSFGTIGVITRVAIRVIQASPYVHVRYMHSDGIKSAAALIEYFSDAENDSPDFIDAVALSIDSAMIVCGTLVDVPPRGVPFKALRERRWNDWFFWHISSLARKIKKITAPEKVLTSCKDNSQDSSTCSAEYEIFTGHQEYMILEDFLFRFDRGAFWMARPGLELFFGQLAFDNCIGTSAGPHILLRIKYAWLCTTRQLYRMLHQCGDELVARMFIVQDFIMPSVKEACQLVEFSHKNTSIWPIWICPVRVMHPIHHTNACFGFPWRSSAVGSLMVNVGIYGAPYGGKEAYDPVLLNRTIETFVSEKGGRKMLYAQNFYTKEEFWNLFDKRAYSLARKNYYSENVFPDVVDKLLFSKDRLNTLTGVKRVSFVSCWKKMLRWYISLWEELLLPNVLHKSFGLDHTEMSLYVVDDDNRDK